MSEPFTYPSDYGGPGPARPPGAGPAVLAMLAVIAGTAALGVAAGYGWAAVAPRPLLVMTGHGTANLVSAETSAFIGADAAFCLIALAGGALSGWLGYMFGVRRHGPLPMVGVLLGALAAGYLARWTGDHAVLSQYHHLLDTLPVGAHLRNPAMLGAASALAFWPLAAGAVSGGMAALAPAAP